MKNKEIEELLNDMQHLYEIHEEIIRKYNNADKISYPYTISLKQIDLLSSYIEQLEKENKFLKLDNPNANIKHFEMLKENKRKIDDLRYQNKQLEKRNKELYKGFMATQEELTDYATKNEQLENNRDKAIEFIEEKRKVFEWYDTDLFYLESLLKGDSK